MKTIIIENVNLEQTIIKLILLFILSFSYDNTIYY